MSCCKLLLSSMICMGLLVGCASRQNVLPTSGMHTVELALPESEFCRVYFVAEDELKYEFDSNGKYDILPGSYLVIAQCPRSRGLYLKNSDPYGAGNSTIFRSPVAIERIDNDFLRKSLNAL